MISIVLIGGGNLGTHLKNVFEKSPHIQLIQQFLRNTKNKNSITPTISNFKNILPADIYIICTPDEVINKISSYLKKGLVVHTSGATSIEAIQTKKKGVFYPLQTFSKNINLDFSKVPICIESNTLEGVIILKKLGHYISDKVVEMNSKQRLKLHIGAVFGNNFTNALYGCAEKICQEASIPFNLLYPIILQTSKNIQTQSSKKNQTGPAKRNDLKTIESHLSILSNENRKIYALLTDFIQTNNEKQTL